ncbi:MAG: DNA topoisomerase VI [Candidatus Krumholzibacteriia bacterium]
MARPKDRDDQGTAGKKPPRASRGKTGAGARQSARSPGQRDSGPATAQGELGFGAPPAAGDRPRRDAPPAAGPGGRGADRGAGGPPRGSGPAGGPARNISFSPVARRIRTEATTIRTSILAGQKPGLKMPLRSLQNVTYQPQTGYFKLKGRLKERTLTVSTVKTFAQTLKMMALAKELVDTDDIATKREAYYVSKNWAEARFSEQPESDTVMEDVEAIFGVNREQLGFVPEEKGGDVAGRLVVMDRDRDTGEELEIDCTRFGSGAYSIPISVEDLQFQTDAEFILCIETAGMFQRLVKHNYWKQANCILVSMGGVPTRACRRFVRRLADDKGLPVYVFVDGDPYGYSNIYRTLKVGSGNAAHLNEYFCVPQARLMGITPHDIVEYELPTHPLKDVDIKRAKDALKNDPFVLHHRPWQKALQQMIKMGVRAEQQALAKHGLNYVIEEYLPRKLAEVERFLP